MTDLPKIGLVGAPRSGNRLIAHMLQLHGFVAEVRHYGSTNDFRSGGYAERVIWPTREWRYWFCSMEKDLAVIPRPTHYTEPTGLGAIEAFGRIHDVLTARTIVERMVPCLPVKYERIVEDCNLWGRRLLTFAAGTHRVPRWKGWGVEVRDGNAKYDEVTT